MKTINNALAAVSETSLPLNPYERMGFEGSPLIGKIMNNTAVSASELEISASVLD